VSDIKDQKRVLETLTSSAEKRALIWMAERMPAWVTSDMLTYLGIAGSAIMFAGYWLSNQNPAWLWLSTFGLFVNWIGDSTDGTLARVRHTERPKYGFYIDHTADVISEALVFLGLGVSPFVRFDLAALAYIGYLAMSVLVYVRTCVDGVFKISYSRLGPTELRIVLAVVNTLMFFFGAPRIALGGVDLTIYDAFVAVLAAGLGLAFLLSMAKGLRELADIDRPA
jgi:phosphatidylglycerophosphate synthase